MKLDPLPVRRASPEAAAPPSTDLSADPSADPGADPSSVDLTAAEAAPRPAALDQVLDWLTSRAS